MAPGAITISRRLRPLRLAFLVRPTDKDTLLRIIRINTCLWGGRYNAIVPVFGKTPTWWEDRRIAPPAKDILKGYIDAFEPDYIVTADGKPVGGLTATEDRFVKLDDVFSGGREEHFHFGLNVIHLYRNLYEREFQFVRRHPTKMIQPTTSDKAASLFLAACFGDFPSDEEFNYLREGYKDAFDPSDVSIDGANLLDVLTGGAGTPLRMGSAGLSVRRLAWSMGPTLYYMDLTSPIDIIDFWNLRALGWRVFPVPRQWAAALAEPGKRFVELNHQPLRGNPKMSTHTTLLKARHVTEADATKFCGEIRPTAAKDMPIALQRWYPRLWDEWARDKDHVQRCEISALESNTECAPDNGRIAFKLLSPVFSDETRLTGHPKWANVVRLKDYWPGSETAQVIPPDMPEVDRLLDSPGLREVSATSEGIVVRCQYSDWSCRWRLPQGVALLKSWFTEKGLKVELSDKGRIALAVTRSLGGLTGASALAHPEIVKLLDAMAHGEVEVPDDGAGGAQRRIARARFATKGQWIGVLKQVHKDRDARVRWHWDALINRGVLRLGLHLKCPQCAQTTWYPLEQASEEMHCERCAEKFPFPKGDPPRDAWSYRTKGAFTVENHGQGSYVVALALRFFAAALHGEATWAPGLEDRKNKVEFDFSLWWARESFAGSSPALVLGECKTFNPFQPKDVAWARMLARRFPGAILTFATLRDSLTQKEKKLFTGLARAGRRHLRAGKTYAPVLILTAHELTRDMGPPHCWQDAGGKIAEIGTRYRGFGELPELCDFTQQIHLGMESYGEWLQRDMDRRRQRWERLRARQTKEA